MKETYARSYFEAFVLALVCMLLPIRMFSYLVPLIVLFWFIVRSSSGRVLQRTLIVTAALIGVLFFYSAVYSSQGLSFLVGNGVIAIFTYSTFFLLLVLPGAGISTATFYERCIPILKWVILVEGVIGIAQFLIVTLGGLTHILNGDAVQGTIGIDTIFTGNAGFGNQVYVINMIFFMLFYLPYTLQYRKGFYVLGIGLLAVMMAGVLHVFISLIWALLVTVLFYRRNLFFSDLYKIAGIVVAALLLVLPLEIIFPGISKTTTIFFKLYQDRNSPKFEAIDQALYRLPEEHPLVYLIGLGPGQYSSRAGLISSGDYYASRMAWLPNTSSVPFRKYFRHTWRKYTLNPDAYGNSTMHRPFFSLLSLFTEFGLLGVIFFLGGILYFFGKIRNLFLFFKNKSLSKAYLAFFLGVLLIMLVFISTFENYLEATQALLPGMMLVKAMYSQLRNEVKQETTSLAVV